ncbi:MAG: hypothetical protein BGO95_08875 [Micrococcales bacterium 73-13]|nr:MAG: hypothetical protein BGO95_08875 [Micrococcales bacterium 73-13]
MGQRTGSRSRGGRTWPALLVFLALSAVVAVLGGLATTANVDGWYAAAARPSWTPPNAVFGPVWTVLYVLIAVAAWLVWRHPGHRRPALVAYGIQLALNGLWTPVFFAGYPAFGPAALWTAFGVIVVLVAAIIVQIVLTVPVSRLAAWLLVPYLLWCLYAATLNAGVAVLNG